MKINIISFFFSIIIFLGCTTVDNELIDDINSRNLFRDKYNAIELTDYKLLPADLEIEKLPTLTQEEANYFLDKVKENSSSTIKEGIIEQSKSINNSFKINMDKIIKNIFNLSCSLHFWSTESQVIMYKGYTTSFESSLAKWHIKGFKFYLDTTDNSSYIFESESFLYIKVRDNETIYYQTPYKIKGKFSPITKISSFLYTMD